MPGGVQPGWEQAARGGGGGLLKAVGVGWTSCHIAGGGSQATLTAVSASTGWTICSTWPMESKGNSAPVPTVLPTAPHRDGLL